MRPRFALLGVLASTLLATAAVASADEPLFRRVGTPTAAYGARGPGHRAFVAVDRAAVQRFRAAGGGKLSLPLADGRDVSVTLEPMDVLERGAVVQVTGADGAHAVRPDLSVFRGKIDGEPDSWVVVSMDGERLLGGVESRGHRFTLGPATVPGGDHVVADEADLPANTPFDCAADRIVQPEMATMAQPAPRPEGVQATATRLVARVAVDADYEYYANKFGGNLNNALNYLLTIFSISSVIYERDINVTFSIPYVNIWTTTVGSPYTSVTTTSARLDEVVAYWNANNAGISRTIVHHLSGRSLGGGIAYINVLCITDSGYGVSAVDATYSYPSNTVTWDVNVISHEMGHNFGSNHTHHCWWQANGYAPAGARLDSCQLAQAPSGACTSTPSNIVPPDKGTIMSYCHLLGAINNTVRLEFHPACKTYMRIRAEAGGCMTAATIQPPRTLTATPGPNGVALNWTASPTAGVVRYDVYKSRYMLDLNPTFLGSTTGTTFNDTDLGTFYYKTKAARAADSSSFSNEVKTGVCAPAAPLGANTGGSQSVALTSADFDEDGILDLAVADYSTHDVAVLRGNGAGGVGNGTFAAGTPYSVGSGSYPYAVATADFDEDGILDLVVAGSEMARVSVLRGNGSGGVGNGTFAAAVHYTTAPNPDGIAIGDFNEDGILDLAVSCNAGSISILLGQGSAGVGNGTFGAATNLGSVFSAQGIVCADFNEDGILDLAAAASGGAKVLLGMGAGPVGNATFAAPVTYPAESGCSAIAVGDFNEDGILDLAITNGTSSSVSMLRGQGVAGVGDGTFAAPVHYPLPAGPYSVVVGDWNRDGIADLACSAYTAAGGINILVGQGAGGVGNGAFATPQSFAGGANSRQIALGDFNEDGVPDFATGSVQSLGKASSILASCVGTLPTGLTVKTANGGESWLLGSEQTISWSRAAGVGLVNVELSRDGGANWEPIASSVADTAMAWTVTGPTTTQALVRISEPGVPNHFDASNAAFSVTSDGLAVDPNASGIALALRGIAPNPATTGLHVTFSVPTSGPALLELLDLAGRRVRSMDVGALGAGVHRVELTRGPGVSPGVYLVRLSHGGRAVSGKAVFVK